MTTTSTDHANAADTQLAIWERWWSGVTGAAGEIVWDAAGSDLAADLEVFGDWFDRDLPVIDLGCGDGRQTRFLADHFQTVVGVDISPSAIQRASAAGNPTNVSFRVLDACAAHEAHRLHHELGDANVYVRGVLQALPPANRPQAVDSLAALLGDKGTLFAKELPPQASDYFAEQVQRHGLWPGLERVMQLIPPGQISEQELVRLFAAERFEVIGTGRGLIDTLNRLPDGEPLRQLDDRPAVAVLAQAGREALHAGAVRQARRYLESGASLTGMRAAPELILDLARALVADGDSQAAVDILQTLLARPSLAGQAHYEAMRALGRAAFEAGQVRLADRWFEAAVGQAEDEPDLAVAILLDHVFLRRLCCFRGSVEG